MTKEISKQICEKCGIDYQIKYKILVPDNPSYSIGTGHTEERTGTLDFGHPENFVKLYELVVYNTYGKSITLSDFLIFHFHVFDLSTRKGFLNTLIYVFEHANAIAPHLKKEFKLIKQTIRGTEWKYE